MNLLDFTDLSSVQITEIFRLTDELRNENVNQLLSGKTFILFFPESSIRSRITFEQGIKTLGGECILFPPETLDKREKLSDVIQYIQNWAEGIKMEELSTHASIPVINAMSSENHPMWSSLQVERHCYERFSIYG
ncbi:hypothetical protein [Chengkuizengella sediminis]|uniref:hypothetical protein n=1 Tax=Chengkuizengella sediminis TaxID=1885917 RepID=UPI001389955A|nr:hypothetical protein [Chengkuizengella sediminis]NDI36465.1 hypothetical protein [Chengkuizengella sediminis]